VVPKHALKVSWKSSKAFGRRQMASNELIPNTWLWWSPKPRRSIKPKRKNKIK
jgi:hypothetical protein